MIAYEYSRVNQLTHPHSYMYTPYEGRPFLSSYRQSRLASGERLRARFEQTLEECAQDELQRINAVLPRCRPFLPPSTVAHLEGLRGALALSVPRAAAPPAGEVSIDDGGWVKTSHVLARLLDALCQDAETTQELIRTQLNRYVARFEVTKKLWSAYSPALNESRGTDRDPALYASLSLALLLYHERRTSLKFLNAALKLNDLLCSVPAEELSAFAAFNAVVALHLEQKAVECLMAEKGVSNGV